MATNSFEPQKFTPSEVTRIFSKMSPLKATRYYNKCMTNPNTPQDNVALFMQYREQNTNSFLTDEQMKAHREKGSWFAGKGYNGGYRERSNGRTYDSYGDGHDNNGRSYDRYGGEYGGYQDGGSERRFYGDRNGFSDYYGGGRQMMREGNGQRNGFWASLWKPKEEFDSMTSRKKQFFVGAFKRKDRSKNTAYSLRVLTNPNTPAEDKMTMVEVVNENPRLFFSKDQPSVGRPDDQERYKN